jgi:hypothetical protein
MATRRRTSSEYFSRGRFSAASSGCRLAVPSARYPVRETVTVPKMVSNVRSCTGVGVRVTPSASRTGSTAAPGCRRSRWAWSSFRINSRPMPSNCRSRSLWFNACASFEPKNEVMVAYV